METYHDYVIKDGKFVGKFEEMYQKFSDPWTQSIQPNPYSRMAGIQSLKKFNIQSVVEWGCGLGYYAEAIYKETGIIPKSLDISETAIEKAKFLFPHLDFEVDVVKNLKNYQNYEAILFAELTWYVLDDLQSIFADMLQYFEGKYFINNLVFYKGTQKYGNQYFTNLKEYIDFVPFQLVGYCEATTEKDSTIETSTIFKIVKK
jgi:SAM-dependent methyltransferase